MRSDRTAPGSPGRGGWSIGTDQCASCRRRFRFLRPPGSLLTAQQVYQHQRRLHTHNGKVVARATRRSRHSGPPSAHCESFIKRMVQCGKCVAFGAATTSAARAEPFRPRHLRLSRQERRDWFLIARIGLGREGCVCQGFRLPRASMGSSTEARVYTTKQVNISKT